MGLSISAPKVRNTLVVFIFIHAFLLTSLWQYWNNTLDTNGNWSSTKVAAAKYLGGSTYYTTDWPTLGHNKLDLGAWGGYQEVIYNVPLNLDRLTFDFELNPDSYIIVLFGKGEGDFAGIRFSNHPRFPSMEFLANNIGEFIARSSLEGLQFNSGWNHVDLRFSKTAYQLSLNGQAQRALSVAILTEGKFGFRGNRENAYIDNVEAIDSDNNIRVSETFSNKKNWLLNFCRIFALIILANVAPALTAFLWSIRIRYWIVFYINGLLFFTTVGLYGMEYFFWSVQYMDLPQSLKEFQDEWRRANHKRREDFEGQIIEKVASLYKPDHAGKIRIMFIGSSQTWGEGAATEEDLWTNRYEKLLNQAGLGSTFECVNTGVAGLKSADLIVDYEKHWLGLHPDIVFINLASNDVDLALYKTNIKRFIDLNVANQIKTALILEPNSVEMVGENLDKKHDILRELGLQYSLPVYEIQRYLNDSHDSGFIWWDHVHLTSYGQKLFADYLFKNSSEFVAKEIVGK